VDYRIDPSAADPALESGEVGDVRDAEVRVAIEIRPIAGGEVVNDRDLVASREKGVDDMTAEKTSAACDEDTQLLVAPLPLWTKWWRRWWTKDLRATPCRR
jgi:hypothetical protein